MAAKLSDAPKLSNEEVEHAKSLVRPRPAVLYEVVREEGEIEMQRPFLALWWSGIAAGIAIGMSPIAAACFRAIMGDTPAGALLEPLGYSAGFVLVILARQQLFTENTITTVLPLMSNLSVSRFAQTARVWGIVLAANLVGALICAVFLTYGGFLPDQIQTALIEISVHAIDRAPLTLFTGGIVAGWLIATLVWVLPETEGSKLLTIVFVTYLIGITGSSHIVAGGVEAWILILGGTMSPIDALVGFAIPTLIANIIGGTALFALISYAQVKQEVETS